MSSTPKEPDHRSLSRVECLFWTRCCPAMSSTKGFTDLAAKVDFRSLQRTFLVVGIVPRQGPFFQELRSAGYHIVGDRMEPKHRPRRLRALCCHDAMKPSTVLVIMFCTVLHDTLPETSGSEEDQLISVRTRPGFRRSEHLRGSSHRFQEHSFVQEPTTSFLLPNAEPLVKTENPNNVTLLPMQFSLFDARPGSVYAFDFRMVSGTLC